MIIKIFENYSSLLNYDCSDDYWEDEGIDEATEILQQFSSSDWDALKEKSECGPSRWKTRCAQTLSEVKSNSSISILLQLLLSTDNDVVEASIDSINSLLQSGSEFYFDKPQVEIIKKHTTSDGVISIAAKRLFDQINS